MVRRYSTTIMINEENEATVSFSVSWGSPETGRFGPVELYDPGSGDVVEDLHVDLIDGLDHLTAEQARWYADDIEADEDKLAELLAYAREEEAADADEAAERAYEARRERIWEGA